LGGGLGGVERVGEGKFEVVEGVGFVVRMKRVEGVVVVWTERPNVVVLVAFGQGQRCVFS